MTKSRNFQAGRTYHVTQRCYGREFLLGKDVDRRRYLNLMWDAWSEWDASILSYAITSNHVHLLLSAEKLGQMSGFMAHVSGGMSRKYNRRKDRKGTFWEGRYRATLVQDGKHLSHCLFYIALNMVRAGVVEHPSDWPWSSHSELVGERRRYRMIDWDVLLGKLGQGTRKEFVAWYTKTLAAFCSNRKLLKREPWWSQSRIVGDRHFVSSMVEKRRMKDIVVNKDGLAFMP
jgi:putative transposase